MQLEKIIRKRTLADGFLANDRLKSATIALTVFYAANALIAGAALIYISLGGASSSVSPLPRLISAIGPALFLSILIGAAVAGALSGLIAAVLWLSTRLRSPIVALLTALLTTLAHLCNLLFFALLAGAWFFASTNRSGRGWNLDLIFQSMGLAGTGDPAAIVLLVVCGIELLLWITLLLRATVRAFRAFASSMKQVPGPYSYSYSSIVMSSSQGGNEVAFLENALKARGAFLHYDDELENIYDSGRYLVRFLHRNGQVLAASLQHRSNRELMAIFPGKESAALNTEVLLEDSYQLQKLRHSPVRATLRNDTLVREIAEKAGWTIMAEEDGLLQLERAR